MQETPLPDLSNPDRSPRDLFTTFQHLHQLAPGPSPRLLKTPFFNDAIKIVQKENIYHQTTLASHQMFPSSRQQKKYTFVRQMKLAVLSLDTMWHLICRFFFAFFIMCWIQTLCKWRAILITHFIFKCLNTFLNIFEIIFYSKVNSNKHNYFFKRYHKPFLLNYFCDMDIVFVKVYSYILRI